jgi:hypothetical protein
MNRIAPLLTFAQLPRAARGAAMALVFAIVVAAPVAAAAPTKTVLHPISDYYGPADSGCGFAVTRVFNSGARTTYFDYADGSELVTFNSVKTITNLDNDKTFTLHTVGHIYEWVDAAGLVQGQGNGQFIFGFYPGDVGPDGSVVQAPGLGYYFTGIAWYTWDPNTEHITAFSYQGSFVDVCAALS